MWIIYYRTTSKNKENCESPLSGNISESNPFRDAGDLPYTMSPKKSATLF